MGVGHAAVALGAAKAAPRVNAGWLNVAGLPVAGGNSPKLGLGLWRQMPLELTLETLMAVAGVVIYLGVAGPGASAWSRWGIPVYMALVCALTWTQLLMTKPPDPAQLIPSWIGGTLLFGVATYALDRKRISGRQTA